jgi:membrane protease YdiL (CAAX protease family)
MSVIAGIFWNRDEGRLRAFWRLVAQIVLFLILLIPAQLIVSAIVLVPAVSSGALTPADLANTAAVQDYLLGRPLSGMLTTLAMSVAFVGSVWIAGRLLDRRRFREFGFHVNAAWWADLAFGLALGAVLMLLIFLAELAAGWVTITGTFATGEAGSAFFPTILFPLFMFLLVGIHEELFSRGYQLTNLAEGMVGIGLSPKAAVIAGTVLASAVFGLLHASNPNASAISTFNIFLAGFLLAAGYLLTGELAISIGLHIGWNFFQGNVFGWPVSGGNYNRWATFIATQQGGPDLWTGGAFGPEAGLLGVLAMALGIVLIALWVRLRHGEARLQEGIARPPERVRERIAEGEEQRSHAPG